MQADLPHTLYNTRDRRDGKGGGKDFHFDPGDPAIELQRKANLRRKARMTGEYTTEQLFE